MFLCQCSFVYLCLVQNIFIFKFYEIINICLGSHTSFDVKFTKFYLTLASAHFGTHFHSLRLLHKRYISKRTHKCWICSCF